MPAWQHCSRWQCATNDRRVFESSRSYCRRLQARGRISATIYKTPQLLLRAIMFNICWASRIVFTNLKHDKVLIRAAHRHFCSLSGWVAGRPRQTHVLCSTISHRWGHWYTEDKQVAVPREMRLLLSGVMITGGGLSARSKTNYGQLDINKASALQWTVQMVTG